MSGNLTGFNAAEVDPNEGFSPIPASDYDVIITESELKNTKDGKGKRLALKLQILNGQYQNRILFDGLNLVNASEAAQKIGKGTLSSICRAVNVLTPNDGSDLHNIPLKATVKIGKDQNGNPSNDVRGYKPRSKSASVKSNMIEQAFEDKPEGAKASPF